ncbi:MAG: hypothetical protein EZS28_031544 [Streblomastix strix]|uniref:Uncharacterized protein n=1 Tax=Streblomastix strix TaxID=222440 RepID=A0A5J4UR55_9EUKA|nr:MAG: hypothetical protein EZS28_031544 [Streblomastix strix]
MSLTSYVDQLLSKQKLADGRIKHTTGLNAKQLQALIGILNVKQDLHNDMNYNQELRTIPSGEAYISGKKGMQGYIMQMVDPDGQGLLPEFATVYTNKGKLYSMGGYIPKDESKYDKYREQYIATVPKGQRKIINSSISCKDKLFQQTNQIEKWGRGWYMAAAQATQREVVREIIQIIDPQQNWANNDILKQGATVFKKQIAQTYFTQINTDEEGFATEIDRIYNYVAPAAINEARRRQGAMQQD